MAIRKFQGYNETKAYGSFEQLPRGGYVVKVMDAQAKSNRIGDYIEISCDIAEGEYKDFFANEYRSQQGENRKWHCVYLLNVPNDDGSEMDGWSKRRFKTFTEALEDSNSGYHFDWDERSFKGKIVGALFNEREYEKSDGSIGKSTNLAQFCPVERIKEGKYRIPPDKLLTNKKRTSSADTSWMNVPEGVKDDLPFN